MFIHRIAGLATVALLTATSLSAQQATPRAVILSARGGGFSALENLDTQGARDFRTGYTVGGGAAVQFSKNLLLRGDFTYARAELRDDALRTGEYLKKYFYGGALQLQYPFGSGFTPYVLAGGGGVTLDPLGAATTTKGQGTFGAGFSYAIPGSAVSIFGEGLGYVYKPSNAGGSLAGVEKTQLDAAWTGGVSYRFRL